MLASRVKKARRTAGTCPHCHAPITLGQYIGLTDHGWTHVGCIITANQDANATHTTALPQSQDQR